MYRWLAWAAVLMAAVLTTMPARARADATVELIRTPNGGIQPQAAVDSHGVLHLLYFAGDPAAGDLYYARRSAASSTFSPPIRVNSQPGSAIAIGTIRGGQIAIGRDDMVHIAWNGSGRAEPKGPGGSPMLYTHLRQDGAGFEPQRNLITWAGGLDGGGTLAADSRGSVYVAWHANPAKDGETNRAVYLARSKDDGKTFEREQRVNPDPTGVCGCCALRAAADETGRLYIFYRAATGGVDRDMILLSSTDYGQSFKGRLIDRWNINACPMSSAFLLPVKMGLRLGWETKEQVYFAALGDDEASLRPAAALAGPGPRKHPVLAVNRDGKALLVWTEGTGWNQGGAVAWQEIGADGRTIASGRRAGVPVWSMAAACPLPDGGFQIIY